MAAGGSNFEGRNTKILTTWDTNERFASAFTLVMPGGDVLVDGESFSISDGVNTQIFEFDSGGGFTPGHIQVPFLTTDSPDRIAQRVTDRINPANPLNVTASNTATSNLIQLTGATAVAPLESAQNLRVTIFGASIEEFDGANPGVAFASVNRGGSTLLPLTVALSVSDPSRASVPATVTIPAGQESTTFPITAIDNSLAEGLRTVIITATALGFSSVTDVLDIEDDETPTLTITVSDPSVLEDDGFNAAQVTITHNISTDEDVIVTVLSNDASELLIGDAPGSGAVTEIEPNNDLSSTQDIDAEDWTLQSNPDIGDATTDTSTSIPHVSIFGTGDSTFDYYSFTAAAGSRGIFDIDAASFNSEIFIFYPSGFVLAFNDNSPATSGQGGSTGGFDSFLDVTLPTAGLYTVAVGAFNSFAFTGGVVGTPPALGDTYTLQISIEGHSLATLSDERQFIIPAGSNSVTVPLTPIQDFLADGDQVAPITAFASGFHSVMDSIIVEDTGTVRELTLSIVDLAITENDGPGATMATVTTNFIGTSDLTVNLLSHDQSEALVQSTITILAGQNMSAPFAIDAVDDLLIDGMQLVTITAYASGFLRSDVTITVNDDGTDTILPGAILWTAEGPGPATNGQIENIRRSPGGPVVNDVVGALQTVIAHPTNPDMLYAGGTNSGVWRTLNATAAQPTWESLTSQQSANSIGALEFDRADATRQTLIAAIGHSSSYGLVGSALNGMMLTTNGGNTWSEITDPLLLGRNFTGVRKNGNLILATANNFGGGVNGGVYRSANGGGTWTFVSGSGGLGGGAAFDIVHDPTVANRYYVSIQSTGIFRTDDAGTTWTNVSAGNAALNSAITNAGNNNAEMAVGSNGRLYVLVMVNGQANYIGFTDNAGVTWTAMDLPLTPDAGGGADEGLNPRVKPGGQGAIHSSIVVDPTDPNTVYVGGDRQDFPFPNFIGAVAFSGRLFRGDTTIAPNGGSPSPQWEHLTHSNSIAGTPQGGTASSSSPHADSREMTFDAAGNLIEVDDGGIYRRTSPQDNTGDWFSIMGNLQGTEMHNVSYDPISNIIISGNQDTGTTEQVTPGSFEWFSVSQADGGDVAVSVDPFNPTQSVRYSSFQNLGAFRRRVYDAGNNLISQVFPTLTGLGADVQFVTPLEVNAVDPLRLIIGGSANVYESLNQGDSVASIAGARVNDFFGDPIAYGGQRFGVPNPDVLYVGSNANVLIRTTAGGPVTASAAYPGGFSRDIVLDPDDWQTAFVVDSSDVFMTTDAGASWSNITGSLPALDTELHSIVYFNHPTNPVLFVGGQTGVSQMSLGSLGAWTRYGAGLPTVPVWDLDISSSQSFLVAGTLGRGAWSIIASPTSSGSKLVVDVAADSFAEDAGLAATTATITRMQADGVLLTSGDQTFTISSSDDTELLLTDPVSGATGSTITVTIPDGFSSVTIDVDAVDDQETDGPQTVIVTALAQGFDSVTDAVDVLESADDIAPEITITVLSPDTVNELDGPFATTIEVKRSDTFGDVLVDIFSTDPSEARVSIVQVTIPDGQMSVTVTLEAIDDFIADGIQTSIIRAASPRNSSGPVVITGGDHDLHAPSDAGEANLVLQTIDFVYSNSRNTSKNEILVFGPTFNPGIDTAILALGLPPATYVNSTTVPSAATVDITQYRAIVTASSFLGLDQPTADQMDARRVDFENYVNVIGGGIFAQEQQLLTNPFGFLQLPDPFTIFGVGTVGNDWVQTPLLAAAGFSITDFELSQSLWHNYFTGPPGFNGLEVWANSDHASSPGPVPVMLGLPPGSAGIGGVTIRSYEVILDVVDVTDDETPVTMTLTLSDTQIFENAGPGASTATLILSSPSDRDRIVYLHSSDTSEAVVVASIVIPAGATTATFSVDAIDEFESDGTNPVTITAYANGIASASDSLDVISVDNIDKYDRLGDLNLQRQQGQLRIEGNTIRFPLTSGITVEPGVTDNGTQSHPGPLRKFPTLSTDQLAPGVFIVNNVVADTLGSGIRVTGQPPGAGPTSSAFARIVNNTIASGTPKVVPVPGSAVADIIFVMGNSGSMGSTIAGVKANLLQLDNSIQGNNINALYGAVRFPEPGSTDPKQIQDLIDFASFSAVGAPFDTMLTITGGTERTSDAILEALNGFDPRSGPTTFSLRPNARPVVIVVTDEDDDSPGSQAAALSALVSNNALFYCICGTDSRSIADFTPFATATGGQLFDIRAFRADPTNFFTSFTQTLVGVVGGAPTIQAAAGILIEENASATILNNIIASTTTGISNNSTAEVVIGSNFFQGNTSNGSIGTNSIVDPTDPATGQLIPLFVTPARGNYYLAPGTPAIDSSLNGLPDRPGFVSVKQPLGLPASPIIAPEIDAFGQKRVDDPSQPSASGLGVDIFKDRGAIERADFDGGFARLDIPRDNDSGNIDRDPRGTIVWLADPAFPNQFVIELVDDGVGIDDDLVFSLQFRLYQDGILLEDGKDYFFTYNSNSNRAIFTAVTTFELEHDYTILVDRSPTIGIRDLAGNLLLANQTDGQIRFDILLTDEANDAPQNVVPGPQTIFEGGLIAFSNAGATLTYNLGGETLLFTEKTGTNDAVIIDLIVPGPNTPLDVSVSGIGTGQATIQIILATDAGGVSISTTDEIVEAIHRSAEANSLVTVTASATAVFVPLPAQLGPSEIGGLFSFAAGAETLTFAKALSVTDRVQVELLDPGAANQALAVSVTGVGTGLATIRIRLATDTNGNPSSTTDNVITAIQGTPAAAGLVTASATGTGIVEPAVGPRTTANMNPIRVSDSDAFLDRYPMPGVGFTPEDGILQVTIEVDNSTADDGVLSIAGTTGLTVTGIGTSIIQMTGTVAQINAAINGLVYIPPQDHNSDVTPTTITITTEDLGRFGVPPSGFTNRADVDTFEIIILPVNDPPAISATDPAAVVEEVSTSVTVSIPPITVTDIDALEMGVGNWTVTLTVPTSQGTLDVDENAASGVPSAQIMGDGTNVVMLNGSVTELVETLKTVLYTAPDEFFNTVLNGGPVIITALVDDNGNNGGGSLTDSTTVAVTINPSQDAPIVDLGAGNILFRTNAAAGIFEDNEDGAGNVIVNPTGITVQNFLAWAAAQPSPQIYDPDGPTVPVGLAITGADNTNGTWEFSTLGGGAATWSAFTTVSATTAKLLSDDPLNRIRFTPSPNFNGTATISFRAWDYTLDTNSSGDTVNPAPVGGATFFSSDVGIATLTIASVNDRPEFTLVDPDGADGTPEIDIRIIEDAGLQSFPAFATNHIPGPAGAPNESVLQQFSLSTVTATPGFAFAVGGQPQINVSTGNLTFQVAANSSGMAVINVTLMDDGGTLNGGLDTSLTQSFTINVTAVNDKPVITVPTAVLTVNESTTTTLATLPITGVNTIVVFDADAVETPNEPLTVKLTVGPGDGTDGTVSVTPNLTNGVAGGGIAGQGTAMLTLTGTLAELAVTLPSVVYTVPTDYFNVTNNLGNVSLKVEADDLGHGGRPDGAGGFFTPLMAVPQTVTIRVNPTNDAPVITMPTAPTGTEGATPTYSFAAAPIVVSDIDHTRGETSAIAQWSMTLSIPTGTGTLIVDTTPGVGVDPGNIIGSGTRTISLVGSIVELNNTLATLLYQAPDPDFNATIYGGAVVLAATINDNGNTPSPALSSSASLSITVQPVNDAPLFNKGSNQAVLEDENSGAGIGVHSVPGWATNVFAGPVGATDERALVPQNILNFVVTQTSGTLAFASLPTVTFNNATGKWDLRYTTALDSNGQGVLNVVLNDTNGTPSTSDDVTSAPQSFTITVTAVNDVPSFTLPSSTVTISENTADSDSPTTRTDFAANIFKGPAGATDEAATQTVAFTVTQLASPNIHTLSFVTAPAIAPDGTLTFETVDNTNGSAVFSVVLKDNGGTAFAGVDTSAAQTFTINVDTENDAPVTGNPVANRMVVEDADDTIIELFQDVFDDVDIANDGDSLTFGFMVLSDPSDLFKTQIFNGGTPIQYGGGSATLSGSQLVLNYGAHRHGVAQIQVSATDTFNQTATDTFLVTVNPQDDRPVIISALPDVSVVEGNAFGDPTFTRDLRTAFGDVDIATDSPPDTLTFTLESGASNSLYVASVVGDQLKIEFRADEYGSENLVIRATDGQGLFVDETIVVTATRVNDPPFPNVDNVSDARNAGPAPDILNTTEDTAVSVAEAVLLSNDAPGPPNELGQTLTLVLVDDSNSNGTVTRSAGGLITYTPDLNFSGVDTFTYTVRDNGRTRNTATGLLVDDFRSTIATVTVNVAPVNDAPTITPNGPRTLAGTNEDDQVTPPSTSVRDILALTASDVDPGIQIGIAIFAATGINAGNWQFSTGGPFASFSTLPNPLAGDKALLLRPDDRLRYLPDGQNGETPTIRYRAWDQTGATVGQHGTQQDTANNGGGSPFSAQTDVATITIQAVNDAPILTVFAGSVFLTGTNEDTNSVGSRVDDFMGTTTDVDNGALRGIALTSLTGSGWEFSLDGGTNYQKLSNVAVLGVAESSALLLRSVDFVRYVPNRQNGETPTLTYRAWDRTSTKQAGQLADITATGTTTAFSDGVNSVSLVVTPVNDAPMLDVSGTPILPPRTEDQVSIIDNPGTTIAVMLATGANGDPISDVDNGAVDGIAIIGKTGLNAAGWEFKLAGGTTYLPVGAVSNSSARLLPGTALLRYVPNTFNGETATISFRAWDASSGVAGGLGSTLVSGGTTSFSTTVEVATILITPVNDSPVANNDNYTVNEDVQLTVSGQGVLQNDADVDLPAQSLSVFQIEVTPGTPLPLTGNPPKISTVTSLNAAVVVNSNGSFTYDPSTSTELQKLPVGQSRQDSFRYEIRDNSAGPNTMSNVATVTLTVTGANDRPVSSGVSINALENGTPVSGFFNSTDIDTGETAALRYTVLTQPSEGTVTSSTAAGNSQFMFDPGNDFQDLGIDSSGMPESRQVVFTYRARDAQLVDSNIATVTVTVTGVNDAPAASDVSVTTSEDGPVVGDLFDVTDADNDTLMFAIIDDPMKGTAVLSGSSGFSFDPGSEFQSLRSGDTEIVTFTYQATETRTGGVSSLKATVTVTITGVNDAPQAVDDTNQTNEDTLLAVTSSDAAALLGNDQDADLDDTKSVTRADAVSALGASVTFDPLGGYTYDPTTSATLQALTASSPAAIDTFTYTIADSGGVTDTATVTITVSGRNDAPVPRTDFGVTSEDSVLDDPTRSVLTNDTDPDQGETAGLLTVHGMVTSTLGAKVTLPGTNGGEGSYKYDPTNAAQIQALKQGQIATDTFTYQVRDANDSRSTGTVSITLVGANDAPTANDDTATTDEDYSPIAPGAQPIIANVFANDFDPDDTNLILKSFSTTSQLGATVSISATGAVTYDPRFAPLLQALPQGQTTIDTFTYEVVDSLGLTDTATVTVNVTGLNDAPNVANDAAATDESTAISMDAANGLLANDTDAEGATLSVSSVNGLASNVGSAFVLPSGATLLVTTGGAVSYDPSTSASLNRLPVDATLFDTFAYRAFDGTSASAIQGTMAITITGVNDRPTAVADSFATSDNAQLTIAAPGILLNDSDVDGDSLRVAAFTGASSRGAAVNVSVNGAFSYDPRGVLQLRALAVGQSLSDSFIYTISDGNGGTATSTVTVTVNGTNDAPQAVGDAYRVDEDSTLIVSGVGVLGNDSDPDATDRIVVGTFDVTSARGAPVSVSPDGTFSYDPTTVIVLQRLAPGQSLTDTFTYRVSDGTTLSNTAIVTITVDGRNDAPTAANDIYSVDEDQQLVVSAANGVLANDSDLEGSPLSASLATGATNGRVVLNSSGFFTYTPNANFNGSDSFTYLASDGSSSSTGTVTINVRGVNDSPTAFADTYPVAEGGSLSVTAANGVLANDVDVDQEALRAIYVNGSGPTNGSLSLNTNGSFTYTPIAAFFGIDSFRYFAQDGAGSSSSPVTVTLDVANTRPRRNPVDPLDVNGDGAVSAIDALLIINEINKNGPHEIPGTSAAIAPFWDVNGDGSVSSIDVLRVVNALNSGVLGEGEGTQPSADTSLTREQGLVSALDDSEITILPYVDQSFWTRHTEADQRPARTLTPKARTIERFSSPIDAAFAAFSRLGSDSQRDADLRSDRVDLRRSVDRLAEAQSELDSKELFEAALSDLFGGD
ncbi:MAG: Ig-like domain-containing protein [Planctomycetota bacterium]|nr:Ig-like domain-containing protein [Planctomycetota bacterium]